MRFYSPPYEFEAVQWKGDNLEEVQAFCGTRQIPTDEAFDIDANKPYVIQMFNEIGTYLVPHLNEGATAEVWDFDVNIWRPVNTGDWIVQQEEGFVPCTDEWLRLNKVELTPEMEGLLAEEQRPKTLERELSSLLNKHSKENESGTPDFILAGFLIGVLDAYNKTLGERAVWRGESVELPALRPLETREIQTNEVGWEAAGTATVPAGTGYVVRPGARNDNDGKEVPLVVYTNGQRNEVGIAKIHVTPGEMAVTATITSVIPTFGSLPAGSYSVDLDEPKDDPEELQREHKLEVDPGQAHSAFQRYQQRGLSDNG